MAGNQKKRSQSSKRKSSSYFNPVQRITRWFEDKHPVLKFLLGFLGCMALFYLFYYSSFYKNYLELPFLNAQASISNVLLRILGHDTHVVHASIASDNFSVSIMNGCDGLEAIAILISGIMIFPAPFRLKIPGLAWGVLVLMVLNLLRIAGLYLIGLNFSPTVFEVFHIQGGFIIFTMISVILWFIWMNWATKQSLPKTATP
jgi:exosortase/archaeosortase family protein